MSSPSNKWTVGQLINVKPRTWAGINRPGGVGKITKLHYSNGFVESLDVKYLVGSGSDAKLDLDFVEAYEPLESKGRSRRGRDLYTASPAKRNAATGAERTAKKAKKTNAASKQPREKAKDSKKTPPPKATDENTDPTKKTKTVRKTAKAKKPSKKTSLVETAQKPKRQPPATHVIVKDECAVSPLADTPHELRHQKKKSEIISKKSSNNTKTSKPSGAKRTLVAKSSKGVAPGQQPEALVAAKKASRPKETTTSKKKLAASQVPTTTTTTTCAEAKPRTKKAQARRLPLKRVYEAQVDRANHFVDDLVGKPKSTTLSSDNEEKKAPVECTVTLSPPDTCTERIDLFASKINDLFGYEPDGIDMKDLLDRVNKRLTTEGAGHFDGKEMEDCLAYLSNNDKVMVSDGVVFSLTD